MECIGCILMTYDNEESGVKVKVDSLNPKSRRVNVTVKVVSKNPIREIVSRSDGSNHKVTEALVGDETGAVFLTLWDNDIEKIKDGDIIDIGNGYVSLFKGSMRLNTGRFGTMEPSETPIENAKTDNNLSDKHFEEERRFQDRRFSSDRGGGGYGDRGGGRRDFRRRRD